MIKYPAATIRYSFISIQVCVFLLFISLYGHAQTVSVTMESVTDKQAEQYSKEVTSTLETLATFSNMRDELIQDIKVLNKKIDSTKSESEKNGLKQELARLRADLKTTTKNMDNIAASVDISRLESKIEQEFSFQKEIFSLLKPALEEMKEMTAQVRKKSMMREKIAYYEERIPVIEEALSNINTLQEHSTDKSLNKMLKKTAAIWQKKQAFMMSELQVVRLQLQEIEDSEVSIAESSQSYMKSFFKKRGLYLTEALISVVAILLLSHLTYTGMQRYLPGFQRKHRSFRIRLIELFHRIFTIVLAILGPMIVFYLAEDWVLFSLGILLLFGIALTLRQTLPKYWKQAQLFLNIGPVREGERILCDGLPWQVERINFFCTFFNPVAEISQRVPITTLTDLKSRPAVLNEPWFPCKRGDWVILNDGVRGKVVGISIEMVQLVQRGGVQVTYQTSDFLANSPKNLAANFRIKEILGISYSLQEKSTTDIPEKLHAYILQRAEQESYGEQLLNLRVEFAQAGSSSLDLVVIADFTGEMGDLYNRLRRAIQRWCVDACTEYNWEIPFPQMTLHGVLTETEQ
ncbi:MAG: mechanosensitive ion channel [gamma proteobacterium symbiont of Lucinoma myriamae]|nr:mechanosensitive ion channel [gamma proteobacterium symbiont of Lucinoma myriamae]MCU7818533.1 mechanosensitive ion channel [gamma proteobacterium symbiont of Lucinoma myriamae]MCU7832957.1 mechanosensitive ion channel [gamma proteobacterium symbiont of Lucinoma myriamae]